MQAPPTVFFNNKRASFSRKAKNKLYVYNNFDSRFRDLKIIN